MEPAELMITGSRQLRPGVVSILIVNWNGIQYLNDCLRSIRKKVSVPHEVILFDNGSEDGSADFVESEFPEVQLVRSPENLGFIRGTNTASTYASGEFYLLLNPDTILQTDIAPAVRLLRADDSIGAVGARMHTGDGRLQANCGWYPSPLRLTLHRSVFWMPYRGPYGPKEFGASRVDWVEGSWLLTPASAWERVGGLDDQFIMYVEDVDYCRSLREIGLATVHMPAMVYTHFVGFSMKRLPNVYAGLRFFHAKFSGRISRWLADVVMKRGLQFKVAVYGALALLLRNPKYGERSRSMQRVLDVWDQMAVPGARFQ